MGQYQPYYSSITLCSVAAGEREKKRVREMKRKRKGKVFRTCLEIRTKEKRRKEKRKICLFEREMKIWAKKLSLEPLKILKSIFVATLFLVELSLHFPPN